MVLKIRDNGRGITEGEQDGPRTLGLLGMRERAHLIGGRIELTGIRGQGTTVTLRVPHGRDVGGGGACGLALIIGIADAQGAEQ